MIIFYIRLVVIFIKTKLVEPASSKKENILVLIFILLLMIFAGILLRLTKVKKISKELNNNEIISTELNTIENTIFTELQIFAQDFDMIVSEDKKRPTPQILDEEKYYPPFVKDASWEAKGEHKWYMYTNNYDVYYIGISSNYDISGDFVLVINTKTNDFFIKYSKEVLKDIKEKEDIHNLIDKVNKMKKIIAYTGEDLIKEARGE